MTDNVWTIYLVIDDEQIQIAFPEVPRLGDTMSYEEEDEYIVVGIHWDTYDKSVLVKLA